MFYYKNISQALIEELSDYLRNAQSIALFAPRFGGKRYTLQRLWEALHKDGRTPLVQLKLLSEKPIITEVELMAEVRAALKMSDIPLADSQIDPFTVIQNYAEQHGKRIFLFAANIDAIAHGLTRRLLRQFRRLVEAGALVVAMTGESDLRELVAGPNSEFTSSENFFLQGFAEDQYGVLLDQYAHTLGITLEPRDEVLQLFWRRTGGNSYLLRPVLLQTIERMVRNGERLSDRVLAPADFDDLPSAKELQGNYWTQLCRHATRLIEKSPECWAMLQHIQKQGYVSVMTATPTPLEWAGVAIRDIHTYELRYASEMMQNYVERHYDTQTLGDLYARAGYWNEAFAFYNALPMEHRRRPLSTNDRTQIERIIHIFGARLFTEATKGLTAVKKLFVRGCASLLGFGEISFWCQGNNWTQLPLEGTPAPPPELLANKAAVLGAEVNEEDGLLAFLGDWHEFAVGCRLQSKLSNYYNVVIVSEWASKVSISRERRRLLGMLLQEFTTAYNYAMTIKIAGDRLERSHEQIELINSVFVALGSRVLDVKDVLRRAAAGLAKLGNYKRVLFCLIDPRGERIQGALDHTTQWSSVNVAELTDYDLKDHFADIQPYIIHTKKPFRTSDAKIADLTNKMIVELTGMKAEAIVPILNEADDAIGTIHVERADNFEPPDEELEDLVKFGRSLATVIEQAERVNLLQSTLDDIPTPVAIVNARDKFRYGNRAAALTLGVPLHWQEHNAAGIELTHLPQVFVETVRRALHDRRAVERLSDGNKVRYLTSNRIQDWLGRTVGAFLYLPEGTDWERLTKALVQIALQPDTTGMLNATLDVAKELGYSQGRLYVIDDQTGQMVSQRCYGLVDEALVQLFNQGGIRLPKDHEPTWRCLEKCKPVVFCYDPDGINNAEMLTAHGLAYVVTTHPLYSDRLRKRPGDFWVDVPLQASARPLGKLSLACDEYLTPERFELLKAHSDSDNDLLSSFLQRERKQYERELALREIAAEKTMFTVAHNLATRFGSFPVFLSTYRSYEKNLPDLQETNNDFEYALEQVQTLVMRAKERLLPVVNLQWQNVELNLYLPRTLKVLLPEHAYQVHCETAPIETKLDPHLIGLALSELVDNSRHAHSHPDQIKIVLKASLLNDGRIQMIYRDNGPGIATDIHARIFDDFFSHRPSSPNAGSGFGMGFVKRVLMAHSGTIEIGCPQSGAEFIITLPSLRKVPDQREENHGMHSVG